MESLRDDVKQFKNRMNDYSCHIHAYAASVEDQGCFVVANYVDLSDESAQQLAENLEPLATIYNHLTKARLSLLPSDIQRVVQSAYELHHVVHLRGDLKSLHTTYNKHVKEALKQNSMKNLLKQKKQGVPPGTQPLYHSEPCFKAADAFSKRLEHFRGFIKGVKQFEVDPWWFLPVTTLLIKGQIQDDGLLSPEAKSVVSWSVESSGKSKI